MWLTFIFLHHSCLHFFPSGSVSFCPILSIFFVCTQVGNHNRKLWLLLSLQHSTLKRCVHKLCMPLNFCTLSCLSAFCLKQNPKPWVSKESKIQVLAAESGFPKARPWWLCRGKMSAIDKTLLQCLLSWVELVNAVIKYLMGTRKRRELLVAWWNICLFHFNF